MTIDLEAIKAEKSSPKPQYVKCGICGAGMKTEHAAAHIEAHRASGWDGTE